jgi:hypothetical protein
MMHSPWLRFAGVAPLSLLMSLTSGCGDDRQADESATLGTSATIGTSATTAGTSTTGTDTTGDDPTGGPQPGCDGVELVQDGVLDLDVPATPYVVVSGQILLNGGALPDADGPRGQLRFDYSSPAAPPGAVTYALAAAGAENYSVVLPAGTVSIHYIPDAALCAAHPEGPMPCSGGTVRAGVTLSDSGVLDLDIPAVVVSGAVTQDGGALPDAAGARGRLEFANTAAEVAATASLEASGPGAYELALFPGTYDVAFAGDPALCAEGAAPVPCNRGVVLPGVDIGASGVLDVDVRRVEASGAVTVNGAAIGDGEADRGSLRFDPAGPSAGGGLVVAPFGATGPVDYAVSLVAGSYTVALAANPAQCTGDVPPTPCVGGPVLAEIDLQSSGVLDIDIPLIEVAGAITLAGGALPDETGDRGALVFARDVDAVSVALESSGPKSYVVGLMPGEYAIAYAANPGLCDGVTAPAMPCGGGPLQKLALMASGTLDLDIPVIAISGQVTLDGAGLPDQPADRGSLVFTGAGESTLSVALATGPFAGYAVTLLPGTYDIAYASAGECAGPPDDAMPCGGGRLLAGVSLVNDGVLDVDIPKVDISGLVTYAGAPLPDLAASRGALRWTRADGAAGPTIDLATSGPLPYAVAVVPGRWIVDLAANPALCDDGVPAFPCTDHALVGCEAP